MTVPNPQLKLPDLVHGLERFGERYNAIDVFADDLLEVRSPVPVPGLRDLGSGKFAYTYNTKPYLLEVLSETGVVRLSRAPNLQVGGSDVAPSIVAGLAGAAVGAAVSKKGEGAAVGLILGLLAGAVISGNAREPRRVFTLRFDPTIRQWRPYDGGLVPWMKENLLPRSA